MIRYSRPNKEFVLSADAIRDIRDWLLTMTIKQDKFAGYYASNAIEDLEDFLTAHSALEMQPPISRKPKRLGKQ